MYHVLGENPNTQEHHQIRKQKTEQAQDLL